MKIYSFDHTIYNGNSSREFYMFCLKRHPRILLYLPGQLWALFCYWFGKRSQTGFWEAFYAYFRALPDVEGLVEEFWTGRRLERLNPVYLENRSEEDLVISGSPECLIGPACKHWGIRCMGSVLDPETGLVRGHFCRGFEKLRRFRQTFPGETIERFWSARLSDAPVAMEAMDCSIVKGSRVFGWEEYISRESRLRKWLRGCLSPEFFRFWCVGWLNMAAAWSLEAAWALVLPNSIAFAVGYGMSLFVSFVLNSKLTFRAKLSWYRLWKYILSYIPNFVIQYLTLLLLNTALGVPYLLTCFLAAVAGTPITFLCLKFFAFRKGGEKKSIQ